MSRRLFSGKPMSASQALKRGRPRGAKTAGPGGFSPEFRRQVSEAHRRFFALRGRDVDSFAFSGGLGA